MLLEARNVHAGYGDTLALRGVDLGVGDGQLVALLGPNGAGKSTLLKVLSGHVGASAGEVRFRGDDVRGHDPSELARCGVYLVPEGRAVFPSLNVRENLRLATARPEKQWGDALGRTLEVFPQLKQRLTQLAGTLSGGEQQMLALARAFIAEPVVLLLDEPSLGLAPKVIDEVFAVIARFRADGVAIVLVEQYVHRALAVADHAVVLVSGEVLFSGSPDVVTEDDLAAQYLGT